MLYRKQHLSSHKSGGMIYLQLEQPRRHGRGQVHRVAASVSDGGEGVSHADTVLEETVDGEDGRGGAAAVPAMYENLLSSANLLFARLFEGRRGAAGWLRAAV